MHSAPAPVPSSASGCQGLRVVALIAALLLSVPPALVVVAWLPVIGRGRFDFLSFSLALGLGTAAIICWWFALRGQHPRSRREIGSTIMGALIIGGASFAAGFFGPIILTPQANQGPLLGIFFTGPLGFAAGAILGFIVGRLRRRNSNESVGD